MRVRHFSVRNWPAAPTYTGKVSSTRRIVLYSIVRVVLFAVPFIVLMLLSVWWWLSAITAAVVAACLSYLFLGRQRDGVAEVVSSWRTGTNSDSDNDVENAALDRGAGNSD